MFLMFLCMAVAYALRVDLSVGIVAMMDRNSTGVDFPVSIHVSRGYRINGLGFQTPVGERDIPFFTPVHLGLPPSLLYYVYHGYFLGVMQPDHWIDQPSHLAPR